MTGRRRQPELACRQVLAQAFEFGALLSILEHRGMIAREEVTTEIKRLREKAGMTKGSARVAPGKTNRRGAGA